jgi:hypothetical protein
MWRIKTGDLYVKCGGYDPFVGKQRVTSAYVNIIYVIVLLQLVVTYFILLSYTTHFNFVSCRSWKTVWQFKNLVFKPGINKSLVPRNVFLIPYIFQGSNFYFCLSLYCF